MRRAMKACGCARRVSCSNARVAPCATVRACALSFSDHPDHPDHPDQSRAFASSP
jgi:hypothetical protein